MLELIGSYFFIAIWGMSIAIILLLIGMIFLKKDIVSQIAIMKKVVEDFGQAAKDLVAFREEFFTGRRGLNDTLTLIKNAQEGHTDELHHIIEQHIVFYDKMKQYDCLVKDITPKEDEFSSKTDIERKLIEMFRNKQQEDKKRTSLFENYDKDK